MAKPRFELVEVAVALIRRRSKILTVFNPMWGSFTLPMTKRRRLQDVRLKRGWRLEDWMDAASRAKAECLGSTSIQEPEVLVEDAIGFQQSDRDGKWKRYHFMVFDTRVGAQETLVDGVVAEWLTADQILDPNRRPISETARRLIGDLRDRDLL